jgi:hypothetical protein
MEKDDELKGEGNSLNYTFRMHDPRVGRFFAVDPLFRKYPHNSTYAFAENDVIANIELEGLEKFYASNGRSMGQLGKSSEIRIMNDKLTLGQVKGVISCSDKNDKHFASHKELLLKNSYATFQTPDDAATFFGNKINQKSVLINKEFAAGINELPLFNSDGTRSTGKVYLLGKIVEGKDRSISPLDIGNRRDSPYEINAYAPEDSDDSQKDDVYLPGKTVALPHTHARGTSIFSEKEPDGLGGYSGDKAMAEEFKVNVYLIDKGGNLRLYNFKTQETSKVRSDLVGSKNKPIISK